jgi:hypothetical protein
VQLDAARRSAAADIGAAERDQADMHDNLIRLNTALLDAKQALTDETQHVALTKQQLHEMTQGRAAAEAVIVDITDQWHATRARLEDLNQAHRAALLSEATLRDQVDELGQRLAALQQRYESFATTQQKENAVLTFKLQESQQELSKERKEAEAALNRSRTENVALHKAARESAADLHAQQTKISELMEALKVLQTNNSTLEQTCRTVESARATLVVENNQLTRFVDENTQTIAALEKKSKQQKTVILKLQEQLQGMKVQLDSMAGGAHTSIICSPYFVVFGMVFFSLTHDNRHIAM